MQPYLKIRSMSDDPIDLYANMNLNEIRNGFIQDIKLRGNILKLGDTPELKELQKEWEILEKYRSWKGVIECCDKALKIDENNFGALWKKAGAFIWLEKWDDALEYCEKSNSIASDSLEIELSSMGIGICQVTRFDNVMNSQKVKEYTAKIIDCLLYTSDAADE